jgi:hypothetical protein
MQNFIPIVMILLATSLEPLKEHDMSIEPFSITATCRDNKACIFEGRDIFVDLLLTNELPHEIRIPLNFIDQIGPYCSLFDNETQEKISLRVGLPDHSIIENYVTIHPRESIKFNRRITAGQIKLARSEMVDLTAKLVIAGPVQLANGQVPVKFRNEIDLRIVGKDKFEKDR